MALAKDEIVDGTVTGLVKFGAFVELPDKSSGLVHISEISNSYVESVEEVLKKGQEVKVKILSIDENGKMSLSIKQAMPKPVKPAPVEFKREEEFSSSFEDKLSKYLKDSNEKLESIRSRTNQKTSGHRSRRWVSDRVLSLFSIMEKFLDNLQKYNLIDFGDRIILGVSGGADSLYLLHRFLEIKDTYNLELVVCHINHLARETASRDEEFVKKLCKEYNLEFHLLKKSMDELGRELKISSEEAGRLMRYGFFREIAKGSKIALAHNYSDQVETLLHRIIRGTGIRGLRGMDFKRGDLIRPILNIKREEIIEYLVQNGYEYMDDETNFLPIYTRNKIRLDLLPRLREYNENIDSALYTLSENAREDSDYLDSEAAKIYREISYITEDEVELDREILKSLHPSISKRSFGLAIESILGSESGFYSYHYEAMLELVNSGTGLKIDLPKNLEAISSYGKLIIRSRKKLQFNSSTLKIGINPTDFGDFIISTTPISGEYIAVDANKIFGGLSVTSRRVGDRFNPINFKGSKKLKDFFIDEKIPKYLRDSIPIIRDEEKILWIVGYRMDHRVKVDENTEKILYIGRKDERIY